VQKTRNGDTNIAVTMVESNLQARLSPLRKFVPLRYAVTAPVVDTRVGEIEFKEGADPYPADSRTSKLSMAKKLDPPDPAYIHLKRVERDWATGGSASSKKVQLEICASG
jgi:hypothetical protein